MKRLKIIGESAWYHIISSVVGGEFYLGKVEKDKMVDTVRKISEVFFVDVIDFCIMSNHFHLIVKINDRSAYSSEEIKARIVNYKKLNRSSLDREVDSESEHKRFCNKFENLSDYVKEIKQRFSVWYNRRNNRRGYFWGDRFKSVLIESGTALLNCMVYVSLNPFKAGMVKRSEDYRWSGAGYRTGKTGNSFLSFDGAFETGDYRDNLKEYLKMIKAGEMAYKGSGDVSQATILHRKVAYFSQGIAIGSESFIRSIFSDYGECFVRKKNSIYEAEGLTNIYTVRKFVI